MFVDREMSRSGEIKAESFGAVRMPEQDVISKSAVVERSKDVFIWCLIGLLFSADLAENWAEVRIEKWRLISQR